MKLPTEPSWQAALRSEFSQPYFTALVDEIDVAYETGVVYPPPEQIFTALTLTPLTAVKVVILGQDPYHGAGQAHGLAFSVPEGQKIPPSLRNIYKEIQSDTGHVSATNGNLAPWAKQGVLLLNATLSVRAGEAGSHQKIGWEQFTDAVLQKISTEKTGVVFMLWGKFAERKGAHIDKAKHLVLTAPHPSPLSAHAGFFGSQHFSRCNSYLTQHGHKPIVW